MLPLIGLAFGVPSWHRPIACERSIPRSTCRIFDPSVVGAACFWKFLTAVVARIVRLEMPLCDTAGYLVVHAMVYPAILTDGCGFLILGGSLDSGSDSHTMYGCWRQSLQVGSCREYMNLVSSSPKCIVLPTANGMVPLEGALGRFGESRASFSKPSWIRSNVPLLRAL